MTEPRPRTPDPRRRDDPPSPPADLVVPSKLRIWDLHCHINGFEGRTPDEKMAHLVACADRLGIERVIVYMGSPFLADPSPDDLRRQNDEVLQALSHWHDRAFGFAYVSPRHVEASLKEIDRCVLEGPMVGIKLWVAMRCNTPRIDPIIRRAAELKAAIFQHTWIKTNGNQPGESTPMDLVELVVRHPGVPLICGHTGGNWERGIRVVRPFEQISIDLAGSDPRSGYAEMAVRELGAWRVMYGSDVGGRSFASQLGKVLGADIPDDARRLILGENLRRMLGPILRAKGVRVIDVNVYLDRWPFRRLGLDDPSHLAIYLRSRGVSQAWAGTFDALLHEDVAAVNARLAETCRRVDPDLFRPFGTVDPNLPDWREDLRRCHEAHKMPGLRLHPNYHGYRLDDPAFSELLAEATRRELMVQVVVRMEDDRTQHPLVRMPAVDTAPLPDLLAKPSRPRFVLLNAFTDLRGPALARIAAVPNTAFDIATLEGACGIERILPTIPADRLLFGSLTPLFTFESARLKLRESPLSDEQRKAIESNNARRLIEHA